MKIARRVFLYIYGFDRRFRIGKWVTDFKLDPGQGAGIDLTNPGVTDIECYLNSFTYFPSDHRVLLSGKFSEYGWDKLPVNNITIATNEVASYYKTVALPSKRIIQA